MLHTSASGHNLCRQVRQCNQQLRPDRKLHVSQRPDLRQRYVLHAELFWEGLRVQRLWWLLRYVSNELDVQWCWNSLPVQYRIQTMRDSLYREQSVLYQQCFGLPNWTNVLQWYLQGDELRFAELRDLRHDLPSKLHVYRGNLHVHLGLQIMR